MGTSVLQGINLVKNPRKSISTLAWRIPFQDPLFFRSFAITKDKLLSTLNKVKTSHGSGHDGIVNFYLNIAMPVVSKSFCDLFNKS